MKIILLKDVEFVGFENELVDVKNGFARNYLIPKKMAQEASKINLARLEAKKKVELKKEQEMLAKINSLIEILQANPIKIKVKTGTSGKIFGKITTLRVAKAIKDALGYTIDRKLIELPEITEVGIYVCKIKFNKGENIADLSINLSAD